MNYPYIEHHKVWNNEFDFIISNFQAEDWYGIAGYQNRVQCDEKSALEHWNNWNPDLRQLISSGDIAIDCGAHHGHITLAISYIASQVIAIELDPINTGILKSNVALNNKDNITILNRAVAEISGEFVGVSAECVDVSGRNIKTLALDNLGIIPDVIKIDIEGYEVPALLGAQKILSDNRPKLEIELHLLKRGVDMRIYGYYPNQLFEILLDNDYSIFRNGKQIASIDNNIDAGGCIYAIPCELIGTFTTNNIMTRQLMDINNITCKTER